MNLFQRHPITGLLPKLLFLFFRLPLFAVQIKRNFAEDQRKGRFAGGRGCFVSGRKLQLMVFFVIPSEPLYPVTIKKCEGKRSLFAGLHDDVGAGRDSEALDIAKSCCGDGAGKRFLRKALSENHVAQLMDSLEMIYIAPSLGGVETLITHPATVTYYRYTREQRYELGIVDTLFRLAVGIEDADDIIADLERGFARI